MTTDTDTAEALEAAIDAIACRRCDHDDPIGSTDRAALHRAITAHLEAEVARRLAAAPEVEESIAQIVVCTDLMDNAGSARARDNLRAAIAADKARAVEATEDAAFIRGRDAVRKCPDGWGLIARPAPDEARRLVDDAMQAAWGLNRPSGQSPDRREAARERATAARTALLRALGVEA